MEVLLQHTSPEQNTEMLKLFSNKKTSENKDIEIVELLLNKGADPYFGNPSAAELATDKGNTQLITLFCKDLNDRLVKAFLDKDLTKVRNLILKVENLGKFLMRRVNIPQVGKVRLLHCFISNIEYPYWFAFFKQVLFGQSTKIGFNDVIASEALNDACRLNKVRV